MSQVTGWWCWGVGVLGLAWLGVAWSVVRDVRPPFTPVVVHAGGGVCGSRVVVLWFTRVVVSRAGHRLFGRGSLSVMLCTVVHAGCGSRMLRWLSFTRVMVSRVHGRLFGSRLKCIAVNAMVTLTRMLPVVT